MSACTFFGHRDCYSLDAKVLQDAIVELIERGVDTFYVGNQGQFDGLVLRCLKDLRKTYPHISFAVVLAYLPTEKQEHDPYFDCSIYPEGQECGPAKFAIERRNRWMIAQAEFCLCYIDHTWGGAYKFAKQAKREDLKIVNLGSVELQI